MLRHVRHGVKKIYAAIALLSIEIIIVTGVFSAALFAFISIANMIFKEKKQDFDQHAFNFLAKKQFFSIFLSLGRKTTDVCAVRSNLTFGSSLIRYQTKRRDMII